MKKLFENWREFRKEVLNEITPGVMQDPELQVQRAKQKSKGTSLTSKDVDLIRQVVSIADPTGVLSWPDVKDSYVAYYKDPKLATASFFLLNLVGAVPVFGKAAAPAKAAKLAQTAKAVEKSSKIIAKRWDKIGPLRALDEAFESGVITLDSFMIWYKKNVDPNATRQQLGEAWQTVNNYVGKIEASDPWILYRAVDSQFKNLIEKFGVGVDDKIGKGGWMVSLASTAPKVWNKYIQDIDKIESIPIPSVGVAVGGKVATTGGKGLARALLHEIGHVQLLKHFPKIGATFLEEYRGLLIKRISEMKRGLKQADLDDAEELLNAAKAAVSGADRVGIDDVMSQMKVTYEKSEIKSILRGIQVLVLEESVKGLNFAAKQGGDIRKAMFAGPKQYNYSLFTDAMREINTRLGIKTNKFYFLQMEEAFAELFEKTVKKVAGGAEAASKNFPKTAGNIQKIISDDKIIQSLRESLLKKNKILISIKKSTI